MIVQVLDVLVQSYFEGNMFNNKIWTGTVEGYKQLSVVPLYQILVCTGVIKVSICRPTCLLYRATASGEVLLEGSVLRRA